MIIDGYPLQFPVGWSRTTNPERSRFGKHSVSQASYLVRDEVLRLGGKNVVISSNLMLKLDGIPYSGQKTPKDCGVAVYFELDGIQQCFPCDRWDMVEHNLWAIYNSIKALRGLERWGAKDMVKSAFKGFQALPGPGEATITSVRYFSNIKDIEEGKAIFRNLALELHPDNGGSQESFMELNKQYIQFKKQFEVEE